MGVAQYVYLARGGDVRGMVIVPAVVGTATGCFSGAVGALPSVGLLTQPIRSPGLVVSRLMAFVVSINEPPPMATKPSHSVSRANPLVVR
jgi:hypothetical protein